MPTNLQIPHPCNEKWDAMTPAGFDCRFCAACQKNIVDFTQKTDAEVLAHLQKSDGRICGRFQPQQLNRPLVAARVPRRGGLAAMAISFAATLAAQQPTQVHKPQAREGMYTPMSGDYKSIVQLFKGDSQDSVRIISGKVLEAGTGETMIGCSVSIENTNYRTVCDIEGSFSLKIPLSQLSDDTITLLERYTGYEEKRIILPIQVQERDYSLPNIELTINPASYMLTGMLIALPTRNTPKVSSPNNIAYKPTFKQRLLHFFQRN